MSRVVQHAVAADEAVGAAPFPHHVIMPTAAVVEGRHALDRVSHDLVKAVGFTVGRVDLHVRRVVVAQVPRPRVIPILSVQLVM